MAFTMTIRTIRAGWCCRRWSPPFGAAFPRALRARASAGLGGAAVRAGFYCGYLAYDMPALRVTSPAAEEPLGPASSTGFRGPHDSEDELFAGFGVSAPWWDMVFATYSNRAGRTLR